MAVIIKFQEYVKKNWKSIHHKKIKSNNSGRGRIVYLNKREVIEQ